VGTNLARKHGRCRRGRRLRAAVPHGHYITLLEIQERLIQNCGERFSVSVLCGFFDRHGVTFKTRCPSGLSLADC